MKREGEPDLYLVARNLCAHLPVVGFDQLFHDGQPDTGPPMFAGARFFSPVEALEDQRDVPLGEVAAGVGKDPLDCPGKTPREDPDGSSGRGVLPGILKEVGYNLGHLFRIGREEIGFLLEVRYNLDAFDAEWRAESLQDLGNHLRDLELHLVKIRPGGVRPGQFQDIFIIPALAHQDA